MKRLTGLFALLIGFALLSYATQQSHSPPQKALTECFIDKELDQAKASFQSCPCSGCHKQIENIANLFTPDAGPPALSECTVIPCYANEIEDNVNLLRTGPSPPLLSAYTAIRCSSAKETFKLPRSYHLRC